MSKPSKAFEEWWLRSGQFYDPDTSDVPWFDKRKFLAQFAFDTAMAQSGNYTANQETDPSGIVFANGRTVKTIDGILVIGRA